MENMTNIIQAKLIEVFAPSYIEVIDQSHLHAGHAGAKSGKGHYAVSIHSQVFKGKMPIACHRLIYDALGELMTTKIHALSIKAKAD